MVSNSSHTVDPEIPEIVAAGAVVVRKPGQVLLVHRPKYDDWSFPKGKREPGEHVTAAAVREVLEETGVTVVLGRPLTPQSYVVGSGRTKIVHYWTGRVVGDDDVSTYLVNSEIDDVRWVDLDKAAETLSYVDDVATLEECTGHPKRTTPLVILRHGRARSRKGWQPADDRLRPLTRMGLDQAHAVGPVLAAFGVTQVITSGSKRCVQTVRPYADERVLPTLTTSELSEEDADTSSVAAVLDRVLDGKLATVLCTHRPVLPLVFDRLMLDRLGVTLQALRPGELVVVHHRKGRARAAERHLPR